MKSAATSVEEYLSELSEERRVALEAVRQVILKNLPAGYDKGCTTVDKKRVCVYHGVNNTVDTIFFRMDEWFPREFQCRYSPNETKPPSIQETFEAIRKSQKK